MYEVILSRQAQRLYDRVDRPTQARFRRALEDLTDNPTSGPNIVRLTNHPHGTHRYRVGGWRLIYRIENQRLVVYITKIEVRGDAY